MTTKAIEAGARAIRLQRLNTFERQAEACIEAAIASGELVPASNRERIAELLDELLPCLTRRGFTGGLATAHKELCELLGIDGGNDWREHRAKNHQPELVPASAVAAERERATALAEAINKLSRVYWSGPDVDHRAVSQAVLSIIAETNKLRALEPASGEYVLVPREPTEAMIRAGDDAFDKSEEDQEYQTKGELILWSHSQGIYRAMLTAATSNGSGK